MPNFKIVVVGGGIAGLAAALSLRAPNREIVVLEASSMNREIGALISLQPNASKIATSLGLDIFLAPKGPMIDKAFRIYNSEGVKQVEIPSNMKKYGAERVVYHRVDLHDSLKQACTSAEGAGKPVKIIPSSRVVGCEPESGVVMLEDGTRHHGDVLIGADGIHSVMREFVADKFLSRPKPTGISAYRFLLETSDLEKSSSFTTIIDPRESVTTMVVGHDRRIVMGPGRNGTIYGVVALVPDEGMHEATNAKSWTSEGELSKLLESFREFPPWIKDLLLLSKKPPALYQLRDIDPLKTWIRGRLILVGDAAHSMLPTQGQGASQSFEDAEAMQACLKDITANTTEIELRSALQEIFEIRYARVSLIQTYSRQQAKPSSVMESLKVKLNPVEFLDYNCAYDGAREWQKQIIAEKEGRE